MAISLTAKKTTLTPLVEVKEKAFVPPSPPAPDPAWLYMEIKFRVLTPKIIRMLERLSARYEYNQTANTIRRNNDLTKGIIAVRDDLKGEVPPGVVLQLMTHAEAITYLDNPNNGYLDDPRPV